MHLRKKTNLFEMCGSANGVGKMDWRPFGEEDWIMYFVHLRKKTNLFEMHVVDYTE